MAKFIYNMRHRPLDFGTAPDGWTYHLPQASRFGWIVYDRELTPDEVYEYELELVRRCSDGTVKNIPAGIGRKK